MGYFFMLLWLVFGVVSLISFIYWLVKRKKGKVALFSFGLSVVSLIVGMVLVSKEPGPVPAEKAEATPVVDQEPVEEQIIDATQFSRITEEELISIMGEPESIDEWNSSSPDGQAFKALIYNYLKSNQEFMLIDGKVVRFTYYGSGQKYENDKHALSLFGIEPGPDIVLVAKSGAAIRYRNVDKVSKIGEFWLVEDLSEKNTIGTVKITYDLKYF